MTDGKAWIYRGGCVRGENFIHYNWVGTVSLLSKTQTARGQPDTLCSNTVERLLWNFDLANSPTSGYNPKKSNEEVSRQ